MRHRLMYAAAAALLIPFMVSCEKNQEFSGTPVSFNISSISAPETKADYSGVITDNKERVDWTSGDLIRIYSATSAPTSADYKIGTVTASGAVSSATISPDGAAEIEWSEEENVFYGVFPSPKVKTADVMGEGTVKGNIPSVQTPLSLNESTPYVAKPNMTNCYMVARTVKTYTEGSDEVSLDFTPITTAIQFEITNNFSNDGVLMIKSISLISENRNISGTFTATLTGWASGYPACAAPATDDGGETVTVDFSSTALCSTGLAKGEKLTFTVFLRPTSNADDLTFKITKPDDSWISTKLMTGGSYIDFPCHKKSYVTGLLIPEGAQWTVKYDPDVASWNQGTGYLNPDAMMNQNPEVISWDSGVEADIELKKSAKITANIPVGFIYGKTEVEYDSSNKATITATAPAGHSFVKWIKIGDSGFEDVAVTNPYTMSEAASEDINLIPIFQSDTDLTSKYVDIVTELNEDGSVKTHTKWAKQNLAVSASGFKSWKGNNTEGTVKAPRTTDDVIIGDYFQWAAYAGYCGNQTDADKGLLVYESFTSPYTNDGSTDSPFFYSEAFTYKNNKRFYVNISPYYDLSSNIWGKYDTQHRSLDRTSTYTENNDDAASYLLGEKWRIPTEDEAMALYNAVIWVYDKTDAGMYAFSPDYTHTVPMGDQAGRSLPSGWKKEDALLFFPSAGFVSNEVFVNHSTAGYYWTDTLTDSSNGKAYFMYYANWSVDPDSMVARSQGLSIRPVYDDE